MGIFKRIFGAAEREVKNVAFQQRAILKADKIAKGQKVLPPKHPSEEKHFREATSDPKLKELVNRKDDPLIEKVNKITIRRIDPPERAKSSRPLPTRETEEHRNIDVWEHGFYEPPLEKMETNRLMLREAIEVLRARMELDPPDFDQPPRENQDDALALLESHPACKRVDQEKLDLVWKYFRPFARSDRQVIVSKQLIEQLRRLIQARDDEVHSLENAYEWRKYYEEKLADARRTQLRTYYDALEEEEKTKFLEKVKEQRQTEYRRLQSQLDELYEMEEKEKPKPEEAKQIEDSKKVNSGRG